MLILSGKMNTAIHGVGSSVHGYAGGAERNSIVTELSRDAYPGLAHRWANIYDVNP